MTTRVVELMAKGKSVTYIAKATGENYEKVRRIALAEFQKIENNKDLLKAEHLFGVNWIISALSDKISDEMDKKGLDRRDAELLLKWRDHSAKLLGFYAPTEHSVTHNVEDISDAELIQRLKTADPELFTSQPNPKVLTEPVEDAQFTINEQSEHDGGTEEEA